MNEAEERKLVLFGWLVTILGNEMDMLDKEKLAKANRLVDKMYELGALNPDLYPEALKYVTRLELIHHTPCHACLGSGRIKIEGQDGSLECPTCHGGGSIGRELIFNDEGKKIKASLQDDDQTLKIFIEARM